MRVVIDTNVLIYSTISSCPWHQEAKQKLVELLNSGTELCLTPQIAREYLVVLTRGDIFEKRFTVEEAVNELGTILPEFALLDETAEIAYYLRNLIQRHQVSGKAIHDANIVAAMLVNGITRLMTYNSDDFRRFQEIAIEPI